MTSVSDETSRDGRTRLEGSPRAVTVEALRPLKTTTAEVDQHGSP